MYIFLLAACAQPGVASSLVIRSAKLIHYEQSERLLVELNWNPSARISDALDHGIALRLMLTLASKQPGYFGWSYFSTLHEYDFDLRYYPLSRQYQLHNLNTGEVRSFAARAELLNALEQIHLPISPTPGLQQYRLSAELDTNTLPGALRLPALFDSNWHTQAKDYTWFSRPE